MTNQNELVNVNPETGEITSHQPHPTADIIVSETADYRIVQTPEGKFKKNMKYREFFSRTPETDDEKVELYKVFNDSNNELVTPMKNMVGKEITIAHVFMQPYDSFNEDNGQLTSGVTTTIQDTEGNYYATSSKSVYYKVFNIMQAFGAPNADNYKPVKVKVTGTKQQNGVQIDLQLIGLA